MLFSTEQRSSDFEIFHHAFRPDSKLNSDGTGFSGDLLPQNFRISDFQNFCCFTYAIVIINKLCRNYNNKVKRKRRRQIPKKVTSNCVSDENLLKRWS